MRSWLVVVMVASAACAKPDAETSEKALARAEEGALTLGRTLKTRLQEALPGGADKAMAVCADEAQTITARVADDQGTSVGRSSLRLRNPKNAPPDWVRAWLEGQGERQAEGVVGVARVDETAKGPVARVIKPIAVEPACLLCHGAPEALAPGVKETLADRYPDDRATGYRVGDLRGALWAETPVRR